MYVQAPIKHMQQETDEQTENADPLCVNTEMGV